MAVSICSSSCCCSALADRIGIGAGVDLDVVGTGLVGRLDLLLIRIYEQADNDSAIFKSLDRIG